MYLDLHQKGDGPYGLVIGPVGSGKSEFLLTLCLSLSLNFSPEEVRLHVFDQKGDGIIHELDGLTNLGECLSGSSYESMNNFISAIDNEVELRFQLFEEYSVSNIYQYIKLRKKLESSMVSMPHLVIAFDELVFEKREYPEVLEKIKNWGNKMNASLLGVHIIFSTQNYPGLINDSIWNMYDFRICSSLQKNEFSNDRSLVDSFCPGRLYLQSKSRLKIQPLQLAYCCTEITEETIRFNWVFSKKTEKREVIDLLNCYQLD